VAPRAREKGLTLVCEIAPDVPNDLVGDPTRLRQVLLNLLGNAIKFTQAGKVLLRVAPDGNASVPTALLFTVSDTGIGIPREKLGQVFERFTQADSSTTRRFGGSGLGLTISKRLVELMGGRIWVESNVGEGSMFAFAAPFEIWAAVNWPAIAPVGTDSQLPLPALRILLAEDSPDNCTITIAYLEDTPYRVVIAETGVIACEKFAVGHFDLVLMDRQMPAMDGLTATRAIRAWEQANNRSPTPIIALTASALKGDRETCLSAGCTAFLTKPIKQEVLLQAIRDHSTIAPPIPGEENARHDAAPLWSSHKFALHIPGYLQNCRQNVVAMLEALDRVDFETVTSLGHQTHRAARCLSAANHRPGIPAADGVCRRKPQALDCGVWAPFDRLAKRVNRPKAIDGPAGRVEIVLHRFSSRHLLMNDHASDPWVLSIDVRDQRINPS